MQAIVIDLARPVLEVDYSPRTVGECLRKKDANWEVRGSVSAEA